MVISDVKELPCHLSSTLSFVIIHSKEKNTFSLPLIQKPRIFDCNSDPNPNTNLKPNSNPNTNPNTNLNTNTLVLTLVLTLTLTLTQTLNLNLTLTLTLTMTVHTVFELKRNFKVQL